jgi:hypothetical protein
MPLRRPSSSSCCRNSCPLSMSVAPYSTCARVCERWCVVMAAWHRAAQRQCVCVCCRSTPGSGPLQPSSRHAASISERTSLRPAPGAAAGCGWPMLRVSRAPGSCRRQS